MLRLVGWIATACMVMCAAAVAAGIFMMIIIHNGLKDMDETGGWADIGRAFHRVLSSRHKRRSSLVAKPRMRCGVCQMWIDVQKTAKVLPNHTRISTPTELCKGSGSEPTQTMGLLSN